MKDEELIAFLQWAAPRLGMRWEGFRKVRRQVGKRIARRLRELNIPDIENYRRMLERDESEWGVLDSMARITISRFYRDRGFFDFLAEAVLPELARIAVERNGRTVRAWSAGCASGEEPYTLSLLWSFTVKSKYPSVNLEIEATDSDSVLLERAREGLYESSSLKDLPEGWKNAAFEKSGEGYTLRAEHRRRVSFSIQDIRRDAPQGLFDMILCRNLVFTYFAGSVQKEIARTLTAKLFPGGALGIGIHESLPENAHGLGLEVWSNRLRVFRKSL